MSKLVKLSSRLPGDEEINGVDHLAGQLVSDPDQILVVIAWIKVRKIEKIIETGDEMPDEVPTIEIARIEPIDQVQRVPKDIIEMAARLNEARTGHRALPFDEIRPDSELAYTTSTPEDEPELLDEL